MNKLKKLNLELARARGEFAAKDALIRDQKVSLIKRMVIKCSSCGKASHMGRWGFVQDYWYTSPHGCNEGDHWNRSETKVCHIVCPKCSVMNYICNHPQRDRVITLIDSEGISKENIFSAIWEQYGNQEPKQVFPIVWSVRYFKKPSVPRLFSLQVTHKGHKIICKGHFLA